MMLPYAIEGGIKMKTITQSTLNQFPILAEGGEARIRDMKNGKVIKEFLPHVNLSLKQKKVEWLIKQSFGKEVVAPEEEISIANHFIGYTMRKVVKADVVRQLIKKDYLALTGYTNKDVLEIVIKIGKRKDAIHACGGIIGDFSDYNILNEKKEIFFIDTDSWGVNNLFYSDAYTETFTAPEAYSKNGEVITTIQTDEFAFAVLAFSLLTRMNPFEGNYPKSPSMSVKERIEKKISVLGNHHIKVKSTILGWKWMSPELKQAFLNIFEGDLRISLTPLLEKEYQNLTFCPTHQVYYHNQYTECPLCNVNANIKKMAPKKHVRLDAKDLPRIITLFSAADVKMILSKNEYLDFKNHIVCMKTKEKQEVCYGTKVHFTADGRFKVILDYATMQVYNHLNEVISTIEIANHSNCQIVGNAIYYLSKNETLKKVNLYTDHVSIEKIREGYHALFAVDEKTEEVAIVSRYPKKLIIVIKGYTFEIDCDSKIREYALKFDSVSKTWLFIYQKQSGAYRTLVLSQKGKIEKDSDNILYETTPLSNISYFNATIYEPKAKKIEAINLKTGNTGEFLCEVVDETSKLEWDLGAFKIITDTHIYQFG